jgi:N-terminal region of glycosyl transferase group 7/N-terminal domain of galactosyltransferase
LALADTTSVAIIVPFRDLHVEQKRSAHLGKFVPHMIKFLGKLQQQQQIADYHIYIIEQSDDQRKFNRGKLLNIGFDIARKRKGMKRPHDVFIFHDVDLLPQEDLGRAYAQFPKVPFHIARVWDRYSNNPKYFGGVVSFSSSDFKRINGYPNTFWGWYVEYCCNLEVVTYGIVVRLTMAVFRVRGGEDDELQLRCNAIGIKWTWPRQGTLIDLEEMTLQEKLTFLKQHKEWKCMVKWEALEEHDKTWKQNGLADLAYKVLKSEPLDTKDAAKSKATKITVDVKLNGNHWANDKCGVDYMGG